MADAVRALIESLHRVGLPGALAVTGGGASAPAALMAVPGASRTVLEVLVPYRTRALAEFLGREPGQACSAATAAAMADRAYDRAAALVPGSSAFGLGCTAALATDRPKKGDHRVYLAVLGDRPQRVGVDIRQRAARPGRRRSRRHIADPECIGRGRGDRGTPSGRSRRGRAGRGDVRKRGTARRRVRRADFVASSGDGRPPAGRRADAVGDLEWVFQPAARRPRPTGGSGGAEARQSSGVRIERHERR